MELYNQRFVNEFAKSNIIQRLANGRSEKVFWQLGETLLKLVTMFNPLNETVQHPLLDGLINSTIKGGWGRFFLPYFYSILADAPFDSSRQSFPDGYDEQVQSLAIAFQETKELSYPVKINTWVAVSKEWLEVCNFDWVRDAVQNNPRDYQGAPKDDCDIMYWLPKWGVDFFYEYDY